MKAMRLIFFCISIIFLLNLTYAISIDTNNCTDTFNIPNTYTIDSSDMTCGASGPTLSASPLTLECNGFSIYSGFAQYTLHTTTPSISIKNCTLVSQGGTYYYLDIDIGSTITFSDLKLNNSGTITAVNDDTTLATQCGCTIDGSNLFQCSGALCDLTGVHVDNITFTTADNTAPTITPHPTLNITPSSPTNNQTPAIKFNVTDENLGSIILQRTGTSTTNTTIGVGNCTQNGNDYDCTYNISTLAEGTYNFTVFANDSIGNGWGNGVITENYNIDITAPDIIIELPSSNFSNANTVVFNVSGTETINACHISPDNSTFVAMAASGSGFLNTSNYATDGNKTTYFNCTDLAGNVGYKFVNISIDTQVPNVSQINVTNIYSSYVNSTTPEVTFNLTNLVKDSFSTNILNLTYFINNVFNSTILTTFTNGIKNFNTNPLTEGNTYNITVNATDEAGNSKNDTIQFTVDTLAPVMSNYTPLRNTLTNNATQDLAVNATDAGIGVLGCNYSYDNSTFYPLTYLSNNKYNYTNSSLQEGTTTIYFECYDNLSNSYNNFTNITVDTTAPAIEYNITRNSTGNYTTIYNIADINVLNYTDDATCNAATDFSTGTLITTTAPENISTVTNVCVNATDLAGNSNITKLDTTKPTLTDNTAGTSTSTTNTFSVTGDENLRYCTINLDGTTYSMSGSGTTHTTSRGTSVGTHNFNFTCADMFNNTNISGNHQIVVSAAPSGGGSSGSGGGSYVPPVTPPANETEENETETEVPEEIQEDTNTGDEEPEVIQESEPFEIEEHPTLEKSTTPSNSDKSRNKRHEYFMMEIDTGSIVVTRVVEHIGKNTFVYEKVKNVGMLDKDDVNVTFNIPKYIVESTNDIKIIDPFIVIEEDPVIKFEIGELKSFEEKVVQYILEDTVPYSYFLNITLDVDYYDDNTSIEEIYEQINETETVLNVTYEAEIINNKTVYTFDLNLTENVTLTNVSIYQEIPKCLIEEINDLIADSDYDYEIVNVDPLIVWHFDNLVDSKQIQLAIDAIAAEDCLNQAKTTSIAREIIYSLREPDKKNIWIALLFIPAIAFLIIGLGELSKVRVHHDQTVTKLIHYVKKLYRHKFSEKAIRAKLKKEKYEQEDIDKAIKLNSKSYLHFFAQKFDIGLHEAILILLILLNVADFMKFLPEDVDYAKKVISWILLGYLLYRVSITKIINGEHHRVIDVFLILSFFMMILKNIVGFAKAVLLTVNINEAHFVTFDLYHYLVQNNVVIEKYGFILGIIGVTITTLILAKHKAKAPCVLHWMHVHHYFTRALAIHGILLVFFIVIFNLMFEWLAIAVDAAILVLTAVYIGFIMIKHRHKFKATDFIEEVSMDTEEFYETFINLFHYVKFIPLAISGMLILYILTEVANFVIPYVTGMMDVIYFGNFSSGHMPLFNVLDFFNPNASLFAGQILGLGLIDIASLIVIYLFNILGLLFLLIMPARVWYHKYKQRNATVNEVSSFEISRFEVGVYFTSLVIFFSKPVFTITTVKTEDIASSVQRIIGVDILTNIVNLDNIFGIMMIAFVAGITFATLKKKYFKVVDHFAITSSLFFFLYYLGLFFVSQMNSYVDLVYAGGVIGFYMALFASITAVILYGIGTVAIVYLYLPVKFKVWLHKFAMLEDILEHQHLHHIPHYSTYQHYHEDYVIEYLDDYITSSIDSEHDFVDIVKQLIVHDWPIDIIDKRLKAVKSKELNKKRRHYQAEYKKQKSKTKEIQKLIGDLLEMDHPKHVFKKVRRAGWPKAVVVMAFLNSGK